jgi:lipoprotein signal peptidase
MSGLTEGPKRVINKIDLSAVFDDKNLIILALLVICVVAMFRLEDAQSQEIVKLAVSGLLGAAVGRVTR